MNYSEEKKQRLKDHLNSTDFVQKVLLLVQNIFLLAINLYYIKLFIISNLVELISLLTIQSMSFSSINSCAVNVVAHFFYVHYILLQLHIIYNVQRGCMYVARQKC